MFRLLVGDDFVEFLEVAVEREDQDEFHHPFQGKGSSAKDWNGLDWIPASEFDGEDGGTASDHQDAVDEVNPPVLNA